MATRERTDIAIITIKDEEFRAVLRRFVTVPDHRDRRSYWRARLIRPDGATLAVAIVKTPEQGIDAAHSTAQNVIDDLHPRWLFVVGIAGAVPDPDVGLGDVVLTTRLHAFTIGAANQDSLEFSDLGGPVAPIVENLVASIGGIEPLMLGWNRPSRVGFARPPIDPTNVYGSEMWRTRTTKAVQWSQLRDKPRAVGRPTATSPFLVKSPRLLSQWRANARDVAAVEMELSGVYAAARRRTTYPVLAIRGISDIVGLRRDPAWTDFACEVAASFCHGLLTYVPLPFLIRQRTEQPMRVPRQKPPAEDDAIPPPPALFAHPRYAGSHSFIGREDELAALDSWANGRTNDPVILFEDIGGAGKSMLTWEWITTRSSNVRSDWAGVYWYSFYWRGATMAEFCRLGLAYMSRRPLSDFQHLTTQQLMNPLLAHLDGSPWLVVLDGLERALVAYNRSDSAEREQTPIDPISPVGARDQREAIGQEDDDLLRALATVQSSKVIMTSRLTPSVLLSPVGDPVPGVKYVRLGGLRPREAESMFRATGVRGDSIAIRDYLKRNCANHPLVIGVLAGLITHYRPIPGDFDAWVNDPAGGRELNLARLDLVQRRNHILAAALADLPRRSRDVLVVIALLSEPVDYATLAELTRRLPSFQKPSSNQKRTARRYEPPGSRVSNLLDESLDELERRGLLQYERASATYDLHPVVRGVTLGSLDQTEKQEYASQLIDHFQQVPHIPFEQATDVLTLRPVLHVARALLFAGRLERAATMYVNDLREPLRRIEAYPVVVSLLRPLFRDWPSVPHSRDKELACALTADAGEALLNLGALTESSVAGEATLRSHLARGRWHELVGDLAAVSITYYELGERARSLRVRQLALELAYAIEYTAGVHTGRMACHRITALLGMWQDADWYWELASLAVRQFPRMGSAYMDFNRCLDMFWRGSREVADLEQVERRAIDERDRSVLRRVVGLRGEWMYSMGAYADAVDPLERAVKLGREVGLFEPSLDALLLLTKIMLGKADHADEYLTRLGEHTPSPSEWLAEIYAALGRVDDAVGWARRAYLEAWGEGDPYVERHALDHASSILRSLGASPPLLPPFHSDKPRSFYEVTIEETLHVLRQGRKRGVDIVGIRAEAPSKAMLDAYSRSERAWLLKRRK